MPDEVTCQCGAVYKRSEAEISIRGTGQHSCVICDEVLETWDGYLIPDFRLVRLPIPSP
jgi:hypothetical protein